jgi:hypothetical protein
MITMRIDVIADLLERASRVSDLRIETNEYDGDDAEDTAGSDRDEAAQNEFVAALTELSTGEAEELLALHRFGSEQGEASITWQEAMEAARNTPEDERLETLIEALTLADAIEAALADLGYTLEIDEEEDEEEETEAGSPNADTEG